MIGLVDHLLDDILVRQLARLDQLKHLAQDLRGHLLGLVESSCDSHT